MNSEIPLEYVEGSDETTLWLWPDGPDPLTVRLPREEWERIEAKAETEYEGDVQAFISRVITADLEEHRKVLSDE